MEDGIVDIEKVKKIKKIMPSDDLLFDIAEVFKVFGDTTRMKIISALLEAELCVGDIAEITNSTQSAISHQLRVLKQAKLVKFRKEGKIVYYSLDDGALYQNFLCVLRYSIILSIINNIVIQLCFAKAKNTFIAKDITDVSN